MNADILNDLYKTLQERKNADPASSYVAGLYKQGAQKIAKKLGEEAVELVIESIRLEQSPDTDECRENFKGEAADLLFHLLVLLSHHNIAPQDILEVLKNRIGTSGLEEKANRQNQN